MNQAQQSDNRAASFCMTLKLIALPVCISMGFGLSGCKSMHDHSKSNLVRSRELTYSGIHAGQTGQESRAEEMFGRAVKVCPEDENARLKYAEALARRGRYDAAIEQLQQALRLSHGDPHVAVRLGEMYYQQGQLNLAQESAKAALKVDLGLAKAWALKGRVAAARQQNSESLKSYLRALTYQSDYPEVEMEVARLYMQLGKHQRALANLDRLHESYVQGEEPEELLLLQCEALTAVNRIDDSLQQLEQLAQRPDVSATALHQYSQTLALIGDTVNSRMVLEHAISRFPADSRLTESLAELKAPNPTVSMNY